MKKNLSSTIALSALLAMLAAPGAVLAQDATPPAPEASAPAEQPPAPATTAAPEIPQVLRDAGLTDLTSEPGKRGGLKVEGKQADGSELRAFVDDKGALRGMFVKGDAVLGQALVDQLVPQSVRDQAVYGQFASIKGVMTGERGVMLAGSDSNGEKLRAAFANDGTLMRFGRGDDERGLRDHGPRGDRGPGRDGHGHGHDGWKRGEGHPPAPGRQGAAAPVDEGAVRQALESAGYTQPGSITQRGPRTLAEAVNPQGEAVTVELDRQGTVMREINR